jgi:hypothetical protein
MAISILHATSSATADDGTSDVGSAEWNAAHAVSGTVDVANGGTGQTTEAEALGEMTQALTADATPDFRADYVATYDASADTGKKVLLSDLTRIKLTADTTFYVRTDGSDSNDGTADTSGSAWLTPQGAYNYILRNIDLRGYVLTVQVGDGTYTAASGTSILNITGGWVGGGAIKFQGNSGDRTAVKFSATGSQAHAVCTNLGATTSALKGGDLYISQIELISGSAYSVAHGGVGDVYIQSCNVSGVFAHFVVGLFSRMFIQGTYTILSGAQFHFQANDMAYIGYFPTAVNTTSSRAFSVAFAGCFLNSFVDYFPVTITGSGVTGKKYYLTMNSCINAISTAISSFPGTTTGTNEQGYLQTTAGVWHGIPDAYGFRDDAENEQLIFQKTASAVNQFEMTNAATGNPPQLSVAGDDTDVDLALTPKGSGVLKFGTHSGLAAETVSGYITIKDAAGNTRKLAVVS